LEFAAGIGAKIVISNSTIANKSDVFFRNMEQLIPRADFLDLYIGLENPGHGTDTLIASGQDAARICTRIGSERVGINFDVGNIVTYHRGRRRPENELRDCVDHVIHLHAKDVKDTGNGYNFVPIGVGDVDWNATFEAIRKSGKDLGIAMEIPLRLRREGYSDPVRAPQRESIETIQQALIQSVSSLRGCVPNKWLML
jgi:sugar phosphate isomerase/epimerase